MIRHSTSIMNFPTPNYHHHNNQPPPPPQQQQLPLLLHICCAPCGGGCIERLLDAGRQIRLFYSNSNIGSNEEFDRRLDSVRKLAEIFHVELEVDPCDHAAWREFVRGLEDEPERGARCSRCFEFSLRRTAERARELGMHFATTLTVSPHKSSSVLFEVGGRIAPELFEPIDFKKRDGFKRGREIARQYGFYLQNFCGCEFSIR